MGRPKNEKYWDQVEKIADGRWRCKKCKREFKGGASRIKAHVEGIRGQGIDVCSGSADPGSVPENEGVDNSNVTVGRSNSQGAVNAMNSLQVALHAPEMTENNIVGSSNHQTGTDPINPFRVWTQGNALIGSDHGPSPLESEISHFKQSVHDLSLEEDDIKGQLQWLESRGKKRKGEVDYWLSEAEALKKRVKDQLKEAEEDLKERAEKDLKERAEDQLEEAEEDLKEAADDVNYFMVDWADNWRGTIQNLTEEVRWHKKQKPLLLSNELVGEGFEINMKKIWEFLGDDQVFIIGVHGIGGVGKTALVTHAKNEIIRKSTFKHVFWVTVSRDFSIFKLQNDIAKKIGVKLDDDDEIMRAPNLLSALETKEKSVLILDDVWKNIDLEKVGVPLGVNGVKVILTSRLKHVCRQMGCPPNNIIQMEPLEEGEDWELFLLKLGYHGTPATLPREVIEVAESVVDECYGLPLGISVMARTLRGVEDIHRWRHTLNKLRDSAMEEEMEEEVLNVLKLSYDNLNDKNMQNRFLYFALYQKNSGSFDAMRREDFIRMLVDEGLINGMRSLEEIFDEGLSMLDKLIDHSLLSMNYGNKIHMHGLVNEMAWHILKGSHRWMVKCNKGLTEIPHIQEWTADLEKVSLNSNEIKEIPAGTSPCCPRLCTFIFRHNDLIRNIPDCFFSEMNALTVLDLSFNRKLRCLPNSVSNLRSLVSLLLEGCESLEYVPPLGELQALSRLIISGTSIKEVPQGLEKLINLKWLDLSYNDELSFVPGSVLPGLTNLQYLDLRARRGSARVNAEDVLGLSVLHYLAGSFSNCENLNDFVEKAQHRGFGPKSYYLYSGFQPDFYSRINHNPLGDEERIVYFRNCKEFRHLLPGDLAKLYISCNEQWRCLCDALSFNGPSSSLTLISIDKCPTLVSLLCLSGSCRFCTHLQNLESLDLDHLESLAVIWKDTRFLPPGGVFSNLKHLKICGCDKMEKLLTSGSLPQFQKLESIIVDCCGSLREIFSEESIEGGDNNDSVIELPKLKKLELSYLPQLKTVCRGIMVCESSDILTTEWCPNLERRPTIKEFDS